MLCVLTYGLQGSNIQLTNRKPDCSELQKHIAGIPAVSGNHCDKNLTKDTCIKFTPG